MSSALSSPVQDAECSPLGELSSPALQREIELQQRPAWLLRKLMQILAARRERQGLGWSRPWNKEGLTVFRTHVQSPMADADYLTPSLHFLVELLRGAPKDYLTFVHGLLNDPTLQSYTFYHHRVVGDRHYEGLTISLGRVVAGEDSKRDRLDLILEDRLHDGRVDGQVDSARVFVSPWAAYESQRHVLELQWAPPPAEWQAGLNDLYRHHVEYYHRWKSDQDRQWSHWSQKYIDYFGPRPVIPEGTSFF